MSSQAANFLLNTENYEPLFNIVKQITSGIRENEKILARITNVVDGKVKYPVLASLENFKDSDAKESNGLDEGSEEQRGDPLRSILNLKFSAEGIAEVSQFNDVENPELRQLLCDNYKLLQIKKSKAEMTRQLVEIIHEYESLLLEKIIPALARDSSVWNLENLSKIQKDEVDQKIMAQKDLWKAYGKYVSSVDKSVHLVEELMQVLDCNVDCKDTERLAMQLKILENLENQNKVGGLHRTR